MNQTATKEKANGQSKKAVTTEQANDALNEIMLTGASASGVTEAEALAILDAMPTESLEEMTGEYFNFENAGPGTFNFIFEGLTTAELSGKTVEVAKLKDKNNARFINGNAVLISTVKRLKQVPCFIRVIFEGEYAKSSAGEYAKLRILTLPSAK